MKYLITVAVLLLFPSLGLAQETPTQRKARIDRHHTELAVTACNRTLAQIDSELNSITNLPDLKQFVRELARCWRARDVVEDRNR